MKGEIYNFHSRQLFIIRKIQEKNSHLILGGALSLKIHGWEIYNTYYCPMFFTDDYYKLSIVMKQDYNSYSERKTRMKVSNVYDGMRYNTVFQYKYDGEIQYSNVTYEGNVYKVAAPKENLKLYVDSILLRARGYPEFNLLFGNNPNNMYAKLERKNSWNFNHSEW